MTIANSVQLPWDAAPATIQDDVRAHALKLATLRHELAAREDGIKGERQAFEATLSDRLRNIEALRREVEAEESAVRALALVAHDQTGDKAPCPGVSVVIGKEYAIDEAAGLTWAKTTRMCLLPESLDVKAVKKMATVTPLPFVTITDRPSVRLASDLLAALSEAA